MIWLVAFALLCLFVVIQCKLILRRRDRGPLSGRGEMLLVESQRGVSRPPAAEPRPENGTRWFFTSERRLERRRLEEEAQLNRAENDLRIALRGRRTITIMAARNGEPPL
jgi:hypothetical protein